MLLARLGRLLLLAAFLAAQGNALGHPIWHASAGQAAQATALDASGPVPTGNPFCAQHGTLNDVLGALHGAAPLLLASEATPVRAAAHGTPAASVAGLAPSSRGPPRLA